jgi:hypothetical protein
MTSVGTSIPVLFPLALIVVSNVTGSSCSDVMALLALAPPAT